MEQEFMEFEEELIVTKELFYNENSMFGAYGFKFASNPNPKVRLNPQWFNFTIGGEVQQLVEGKTYTVRFRESFDERKGIDTYTFIEVKSDGIKGKESNHQFIQAILSEGQAEAIIDHFPFEEELVKDIIEGRVDLTQIKGIGADRAASIINKLSKVDLYSEAVVKLAPIGIGINAIVKLCEHFNNSPEKVLQVVKENIYKLTEVSGFGFKRIDDFALKMDFKLDDPRRIKAGAVFVIEEMVAFGDTRLDIENFESKLCDILDITEVTDELFEVIMTNKEIYYHEGYISLKKYYAEEKAIVKHLRRLRDSFTPEIEEKEIMLGIEMRESEQGFKYNEKQRQAIFKACNSGVFILDGKAGSGKTQSLKAAINAIGSFHLAVALSGKAANVLSKNGLNASTIHRALKFDPKTGGFVHGINNPLSFNVFILDEASMVDNKLLLELLEAIPNGAQLMIVGDSGQLPAIGRGATFDYLLSSSEFEHVTLTEVHRQALDSGTLSVANMVREGKQFNGFNDYGMETYGNNKDFYYFGYQDKTEIVGDIYNMVKRYVENPEMNKDDVQVITGLKERGDLSVVNLNNMLQPLFNPKSLGDEIKGKKYVFRKGDRVIQQGNNYKATKIDRQTFINYTNGFIKDSELKEAETQVFNGTFGKIVELVEGYGMLIDFEDVEGLVFYRKDASADETGVLDLGYVISCHRSQGSGFKTLFVALSFNDYMLLSRQFLYTALTRTINNCFLFAETSAVHYAIKTDKGKTRKCFIGEFLK